MDTNKMKGELLIWETGSM